MGVGVFFLNAPGDGTNSDHSSFDATGADATAGRGRGRGVDDGIWRCEGASVSPRWFNQVAIAESGDGASIGAALAIARMNRCKGRNQEK
jgi:hypothetical protein